MNGTFTVPAQQEGEFFLCYWCGFFSLCKEVRNNKKKEKFPNWVWEEVDSTLLLQKFAIWRKKINAVSQKKKIKGWKGRARTVCQKRGFAIFPTRKFAKKWEDNCSKWRPIKALSKIVTLAAGIRACGKKKVAKVTYHAQKKRVKNRKFGDFPPPSPPIFHATQARVTMTADLGGVVFFWGVWGVGMGRPGWKQQQARESVSNIGTDPTNVGITRGARTHSRASTLVPVSHGEGGRRLRGCSKGFHITNTSLYVALVRRGRR